MGKTPETYEGYTSEPVYPSSITVVYDYFNAPNAAASTWVSSSANDFTPSSTTPETSVLNGDIFPTKATVSVANKYVTLEPGLWRVDAHFIGHENNGTAVEIGLAIADDAATANEFAVFDAKSASPIFLGASQTLSVALSSYINISVATNIRLIAAERLNSAGQLGLFHTRATFTRIANYAAH